MTITDLMIEGVETAGPNTTAEALALRLARADIGSSIIEEDMRPIGIVTDRDLAVQIDAQDQAASVVKAAEVMTEDPVTISEDAGLLAVTRTMCDHSVRRLPVVNDTGTLWASSRSTT